MPQPWDGPFRLEVCTVCVGYGDFLAETARQNRGLFDRWLVVTTADDAETREVCRHYNLETLLSDDATRGGADFNKGRLVERGLQQLSAGAWHMHLDGDVVLPPTFRLSLEAAHLDPSCVYGCDRLMVRSWEEWVRLRDSGALAEQHTWHYSVNPTRGLPLGTRWVSPSQGWVPIGFLQLWFQAEAEWHGVRVKTYPLGHGDACRADVQYGLKWDRRKRQFLPEVFALHLESEPSKLGANWRGRTTKRFGPGPETRLDAAIS